MITATAQLDLREWERAIGALKEKFKRRTLGEIINRSAGSIALKSLINTKHADPKKIRDYFKNVTGVKITTVKTGKNAGKLRTSVQREVNKIARCAYLKRHPELRGQRLKSGEFINKVKDFVAKSISSTHYLRHGWKEVIDKYRPWMKGSTIPGGHRHKSGKRKLGTGSPAGAGGLFTTEATIFNRAVIKHEGARPMMQAALEKAVRDETAQLQATAEKLIKKDIEDVGGGAKNVFTGNALITTIGGQVTRIRI
jgi:hypothetical protein